MIIGMYVDGFNLSPPNSYLSVGLLYHKIQPKSIYLINKNWTIPHKFNEMGIKWTIYILRQKTKKACKDEIIPASLNFCYKTYEKGQNAPMLAIKKP